jgi:adenylate kinase
MPTMNILLVGIQGSGKGTMARKIIEHYPFHFFEMGQKLRNFSQLDEPGSKELRTSLAGGNMATDELVTRMLEHYFQHHSDKPIVFDGIPRTPDQKKLFDTLVQNYIVLFLDLPKDTAIERLSGRRIDPSNGESFPANFIGDFSPFTGTKLVKREDDTPEAASKRIDAFYANTLPLLASWAEEGRHVFRVDARKDPETCFHQIEAILSGFLPRA